MAKENSTCSQCFVINSVLNLEPVQGLDNWNSVFSFLDFGSSILNKLELYKLLSENPGEENISIAN